MAKLPFPLIAETPDWEKQFRHPTPLTSKQAPLTLKQVQQIVERPLPDDASEQTRLLREIKDYLKYLTTKKYYLDFPPDQIRMEEYCVWLNYSASGADFVNDTIDSFYIGCDLAFAAAITDSAGIQGGVPIQCEPYELLGFVNFFVLVNGVPPTNASYTYHDLVGAIQNVSGWGILTKTYDIYQGIQPFYSKPGDHYRIGYQQLQAPLRTVGKVGYYEKSLIVDKVFLQKAGIVRI